MNNQIATPATNSAERYEMARRIVAGEIGFEWDGYTAQRVAAEGKHAAAWCLTKSVARASLEEPVLGGLSYSHFSKAVYAAYRTRKSPRRGS